VEIESDAINVGDMIHVRGHTTDFTQPVESIELENEHIDRAEPGQNVGIKVREHARENDWVMKIVTD
jgi:putative protease